jgi:riboflavin biosynthesis pyrimidine reductase
MRRLLPDPAPTTVGEQLDSYRPWESPHEQRPFVATNFAATVDGRATIGGVSGPIGSDADTAMLVGLRTRFDAVMIGAGTMRAERYGPLVADQEKRERRERLGLPHDPLVVIVSGREKRLIVVESGPDGRVDLADLLQSLRKEGVRALLCEGGPTLHGALQAEGLVDELFLTVAPKLTGGEAPRIVEGPLPEIAELELAWLLEQDGELFARYKRR